MSKPEDYKYIPKSELRELCAFKDRTIEILQGALHRKDNSNV